MKLPCSEHSPTTAEPLQPVCKPDTQSKTLSRTLAQTRSRSNLNSRRALFATGLFAAAALLNEETPASAQSAGGYDPTVSWKNASLRLVRRITLGLDAEEAALAKKLGYSGYLDYQLKPAGIEDDAADSYIALNYPTLTMTPKQLIDIEGTMGKGGTVNRELIDATLFRSAFSKRQLYQRMVEFWNDHFNIDIHKVGVLKTGDDLSVARTHALGTFPELLLASAMSPAMLLSLDNAHSAKAHPNQNYARELMELHTLSVNGGYTQQDVVEVARCFTGWRVHSDSTKPEYGTFYFDAKNHDNGKKNVLGTPIPENGGVNDGILVLKLLAKNQNTAKFISTKMTKWLLSSAPTVATIDAVSKVYLNTAGDIPSMIREILKQSNLVKAPAKYKRPSHLVSSSIRATGAAISDWGSIRNSLSNMGQSLFNWAPPNGYPDAMPFWAGLVLPRWDFAAKLAQNALGAKIHVDVTALVNAKTPDKIAQLIDEALFAGEMPPKTLADVKAWLKPEKTSVSVSEGTIREAVALALSSLNFQWY